MKSEAQRVLQAMTPAQKLRAEQPDWTEEAIQQAVRQIFLCAKANLFLMFATPLLNQPGRCTSPLLRHYFSTVRSGALAP